MTTIDASLRALEIQGSTVPKLGFGTWEILGRDCEEAVDDALEIGYRHIDTAQAYENEAEVGKALAASGVPRNELFLTTKLWRDEFARRPRAARGRRLARAAAGRLRRPPAPALAQRRRPARGDAGRARPAARGGLVRHYGVSNVPAGMLREALKLAPIFADQVEFHPYLGQQKLVDLAVEKDFMVTAYSPLARGKVPKDETLRGSATRTARPPARSRCAGCSTSRTSPRSRRPRATSGGSRTSRSSTSSSATRTARRSTRCPRTSA